VPNSVSWNGAAQSDGVVLSSGIITVAVGQVSAGGTGTIKYKVVVK
jgi:hypothetical protein